MINNPRGNAIPESGVVVAAIMAMMLTCLPLIVLAGPQVQAGAYHIELTTQAGSIPATGGTRLLFTVTDSAGKPVEGVTIHSLTKMPGMNMGELEETATPVPGKPGVYTARASFAMEGAYEDTLKVDGPLGSANARIPLATGQSTRTSSSSSSGKTAGPSSNSAAAWIIGIVAVALVLLVLQRMKRAGQPASMRGVFNRSVIGALIMLGLIWWGAIYAVNHFRRAGAWTPIEAQGMEMNLPAPVGTAPVELATVESGSMDITVAYSGQAVGYVEQDVSPRVTGVIVWMPFYPGDHVKRGQLLARLDTSQSAPLVETQRGQLAVSREGVAVAQKDYQQAQAMVSEAHAEVGMKTGAMAAAQSDVTAAEQERSNALASQEAVQSMLVDANAQLDSAQADQQYWKDEITREASLLKAGAVTREEYQRELAQAQNAAAKVTQARAHITESQAQILGAESEVLKADAMISSAKAKLQQAQAELGAHEAHVRSAQAAAASASQKITQADAGVRQAQGMLAGAAATQAYSEIHAETDGVVTRRLISPGVLVNPGQSILRLAQISPIRLQANVTETDLQQIQVGSLVKARSRTRSGAPLVARVTSISPSVDPVSRTGIVEAIVANQGARILPGEFVTLEFTKERVSSALHIPTRALRYHTIPSGGATSMLSTPTVWIADPVPGQDNRFTVREATVRTGPSDANRTEIASGLKAGERVVTAGQDYLKDGDTVTVPSQSSATERAGNVSERQSSAMPVDPVAKPHAALASHILYRCPMHPEILRDSPGKCPRCGMTLVAKTADGAK